MTLFSALLETIAKFGADRPALEDVERQPLTYGRLVLGALVLGNALARDTRRGRVRRPVAAKREWLASDPIRPQRLRPRSSHAEFLRRP